jgi:hypothetical protein
MRKAKNWPALAGVALALALTAGAAVSQSGRPTVAALLTQTPLEHLAVLVGDPAVAASLDGKTLLAPLAGPLPADRAGFLERHTLEGVHTLASLVAAASKDPSKRVVFGGTILALSDLAPGRLIVVDGLGNTAKVLFEKPASGGWILVIDRPLGSVAKPLPPKRGGGAFIALP